MTHKNQTSRFNQYDRVECTTSEHGIKIGELCTVHAIDEEDNQVALVVDGESGWHWFDEANFKRLDI